MSDDEDHDMEGDLRGQAVLNGIDEYPVTYPDDAHGKITSGITQLKATRAANVSAKAAVPVDKIERSVAGLDAKSKHLGRHPEEATSIPISCTP